MCRLLPSPRDCQRWFVERVLDLLFIVTLLPLTVSQLDSMPLQIRTAGQATGIAALGATIVLIAAANFRPKVITFALHSQPHPFLNTERWIRVADDLLRGLDNPHPFAFRPAVIFWSIALWVPMIWRIPPSCGLSVSMSTSPLARL